MSKFFDFDQFWKETQTDEPGPVIRVFGEDVELPKDLPAAVPIRALRLQAMGSGEIPAEEIVHLADVLFGREQLDKWLSEGLTMAQLGDLIRHSMTLYRSDEEGEAGVNPTKPNRAQRR